VPHHLPVIHLCACLLIVLLAACAPQTQQVFQATLPPTVNNAPIYTETPTATATATPTATDTPTATATSTPFPTNTPRPLPTMPLLTLTPASAEGAPPPIQPISAGETDAEGWSCEEFPCADDIDGFLRRIQVQPGFTLAHVGRFPGQPMQIAYGRDGRLYATLLENGTRSGAVYVMNADGTSERYSGTLVSPVGLAFQPGTDALYVSGRVSPMSGGALWRIPAGGGEPETVIDDLPCCFQIIDSQPNGITFGADGYLYLGVSALSDQAEPPPGPRSQYLEPLPYEASILRIQPHTGAYEVFARGIRSVYDIAFDSRGQMYASDNGLLSGAGDRLLQVRAGGHYGWPYYGALGCEQCPPLPPTLQPDPALLLLPPYTLPRGMVAYTGTQFPANMFDSLFVTFWNGIEGGQRVVRIDPRAIPTDPEQLAAYVPEAFVTGLIRPVDVVIAPDGSLVIADFIYGHIWRVSYSGV
jgi:glucose/arabinose dehydrogenase